MIWMDNYEKSITIQRPGKGKQGERIVHDPFFYGCRRLRTQFTAPQIPVQLVPVDWAVPESHLAAYPAHRSPAAERKAADAPSLHGFYWRGIGNGAANADLIAKLNEALGLLQAAGKAMDDSGTRQGMFFSSIASLSWVRLEWRITGRS